MATAKTEFQTFLTEEIKKVRGVYYPVKAGFLRRVLVKRAPFTSLHPNPNDEFCFPEIGPNYEIISNYEHEFRQLEVDKGAAFFVKKGADEPVIVEKTRPDGYMLLNGHHRWAAARRVGVPKMKIKIVDLTQEKDIRKMLEKSRSDKRVTLDLDEVILRPEGDACLEKALPFPMSRIYKERIRMGTPALFHFLKTKGYDIWVYTAQYYSLEYLKHYFKYYRVDVTGIVTGAGRKGEKESDGKVEKMLEKKYSTTLHIENDHVLQITKGTKEYEDRQLSGNPSTWASEVMDAIGEMKQHE